MEKELYHHLSEEEKQKLLQLSEISILLDSYDDIFSDFDPRPFSQRALSDDFLLEAKKAAKEKAKGIIELKLMIPSKERNQELERVIKRRLRSHFKEHYEKAKKEVKNLVKKGFLFLGLGVALMIFATYLLTIGIDSFTLNLLIVLAEPGGWFLFWTGLDQFFNEIKSKKPELEFYERMSKCEITFFSY
ncbi:MAG: hypothetical protein NZ889_01645 [Candidatus Pacearchaeota archaeon]|nr:hypothetical protein [Candidatus Pacearchaeota archaeon]